MDENEAVVVDKVKDFVEAENHHLAYWLILILNFAYYPDIPVDLTIVWYIEHSIVHTNDNVVVIWVMMVHLMYDDQSLSNYAHVIMVVIDIPHGLEQNVFDHLFYNVQVNERFYDTYYNVVLVH